jgi:hypothetical protein
MTSGFGTHQPGRIAAMITTSMPEATASASRPPRDRVGRVLLWIAAVGAAGAAVSAISTVLGAGGTTKVVETWRLYGFVVFAGLFVLLALRPLAYRGVWELAVFNKLALTATALAYAAHGGISGTGSIIAWDGGLSLVLIVAYVCCRGWTAWSAPDRGPRP